MDREYSSGYPELYRRHWWWRVREEILLKRIDRLLNGTKPCRLLDVGCGAGLFFDALSRFGDIEGIESDAESVAHSGKWRHRIHLGILDASFDKKDGYDLVLMLDLLEHVDKPDELLRAAASVLRPHGYILITVPAFQWLWTTHDVLNHHVRRYNAAQLRQAITDAGFANVRTEYLFQSLIFPKMAIRVAEAMRPRPPRLPRIPARLLNTALQAWCRLEYGLAGWLPFGGSVLAVAGAGTGVELRDEADVSFPRATRTGRPSASRK